MKVAATFILLIVAIVCIGNDEPIQGCLFLVVLWILSILSRREDSNEFKKKTRNIENSEGT